jgi:DnaJ-class molecular chaperone
MEFDRVLQDGSDELAIQRRRNIMTTEVNYFLLHFLFRGTGANSSWIQRTNYNNTHRNKERQKQYPMINYHQRSLRCCLLLNFWRYTPFRRHAESTMTRSELLLPPQKLSQQCFHLFFLSRRKRFQYNKIIILVLVLLVVTTSTTCLVYAGGTIPDPYQILGVSPYASPKEIQKQYRKLCLKYHPDKTMNLSIEQRKRYETQFKRVQEAYSKIDERYNNNNNNNNRNNGPSSRPFFPHGTTGRPQSTPYGSDPVAEAFFRAFDMSGRPRSNHAFFYQTQTGTSSSSSSSSSSFSSPNFGGFRTAFPFAENPPPMMPSEVSFKSIYVQTVHVPLEKLYRGVKRYPLRLQDNLWTRYKAAWRGKILFLSLYQGMLYSAPILRINTILATIVGLFIMHSTLPRPNHHHPPTKKTPFAESLIYTCDLKPGTKECTVKFASTRFGQPEVIFKVVDEPHPSYRRKGNDLHTSVYISEDEAEDGCMIRIEALDASEDPLEVVIPPQLYSYTKQQQSKQRQSNKTLSKGNSDMDHTSSDDDDNDNNNNDEYCYDNIIRIPNRGWPTGNANLKGDAVVTVLVKKKKKFRN